MLDLSPATVSNLAVMPNVQRENERARISQAFSKSFPTSEGAQETARTVTPGTALADDVDAVSDAVMRYQSFGSAFDGARLLAAALTGVESPADDIVATVRKLLPSLSDLAGNVRSVPVAAAGDEASLREAAANAGTDTALPPQARAAYVAGPDGGEGAILLADTLSGKDLENAALEEVGQALARRAALKGIELAPGDVGARLRVALGGTFINPQNNPEAYQKKPLDGGDVLFAGNVAKARFQPAGRQQQINQTFNQRRGQNAFVITANRPAAIGGQGWPNGNLTPENARTRFRESFFMRLLATGFVQDATEPFAVALTQQEFQQVIPPAAFRAIMQNIAFARNGPQNNPGLTDDEIAEILEWMGAEDIGFLDGRYVVENLVELPRNDEDFFGADQQVFFETAIADTIEATEALPVQVNLPAGNFDLLTGVMQDNSAPEGNGNGQQVLPEINDVAANANQNGPISNLFGGVYFNDDFVELVRQDEDIDPDNRPSFAAMGYLPDVSAASDMSEDSVFNAPDLSDVEAVSGEICAINPSNSTCP